MEINIKFDCSYEGTITIDGREMVYGYSHKDGCWKFLKGLSLEESENTIGGIVACFIAREIMIELLQHSSPEYDNPKTNACWEAWETLDEDSASEILDHLS